MTPARGFHLRFAVGSPKGPRSGLWRIWTAKPPKSDVYLAARSLAGALKASLHESGSWQVSFTSQFEDRLRDEGAWSRGSRHIDLWPRTELTTGITLAFRVYFPASELRVMPQESEAKKPVKWISPPSANEATEVAVLFTQPGVTTSHWPGQSAMGTQPLASTELPNGETLWIVHRSLEMTEQTIAQIEAIPSRLAERPPDLAIGNLDEIQASNRIMIAFKDTDGSRCYLEVAADTPFGGA